MTRLMYDAADPVVIVRDVPADAFAVAGYVPPVSPSNRYVTFPAVVERFYPRAHCFSIAVQPWLIAACLDVETGDATPADAPGWYRKAKAAGQWRPCFYANASTMPAVQGELERAGIPRGDYRLWVAAYPGTGVNVPAGMDAHQYTDHGPHGENYDVSVVSDDFFPPPPKPKKRKPKPPHPKVIGASAGAALGAGISAILVAAGVHITPPEASAISTLGAALAGYITPATRAKKAAR